MVLIGLLSRQPDQAFEMSCWSNDTRSRQAGLVAAWLPWRWESRSRDERQPEWPHREALLPWLSETRKDQGEAQCNHLVSKAVTRPV